MLNFRQCHPMTLIIYYVSLIIFLYSMKQIPLMIMTALMLFIMLTLYKSARSALQELIFISWIASLLAIAFIFLKHNGYTPLFYLNDQAVTREVIIYAFYSSLLLIAVWFLLLLLQSTISAYAIIHLFGRISPKLSVFISLAAHFIPAVKGRCQTLVEAQKSLGYFRTKSIFEKVINYIKIVQESIYWTFEQSFQKSLMMRERAYKRGKRSHYKRFSLSIIDVLLLLFSAFLYWILWQNFEQLRFYYFPMLKETALQKIIIPYIFFISVPVIMECKGWLQWQYYKSKM